MSTEQEIGVSVWLPRARSVIREEPGSPRYFSFNGLCTDLRSMTLPSVAAFPPANCNAKGSSEEDPLCAVIWSVLTLQQEGLGVFDQLLYSHEEAHGLGDCY